MLEDSKLIPNEWFGWCSQCFVGQTVKSSVQQNHFVEHKFG